MVGVADERGGHLFPRTRRVYVRVHAIARGADTVREYSFIVRYPGSDIDINILGPLAVPSVATPSRPDQRGAAPPIGPIAYYINSSFNRAANPLHRLTSSWFIYLYSLCLLCSSLFPYHRFNDHSFIRLFIYLFIAFAHSNANRLHVNEFALMNWVDK